MSETDVGPAALAARLVRRPTVSPREEGAVAGTRKGVEGVAQGGEARDACLVGEPASARVLGDMIKIGRRGSLTGHLTAHGMQGHTAYPHLADNAAHRLVTMLHTLTTAEL